MQKRRSKILMLILAAVLAVSAPMTTLAAMADYAVEAPKIEAAVPISAPMEESAESGFETALLAVKSLIDIDEDIYTVFNYNSSYSNYITREGLVWSFNWSGSADRKYSYIYASATEDGILLDYYKYSQEGKDFGLAVISKADAVVIADEFIKKANPYTYQWYRAEKDIYVNINNREYSLVYYAESDGYQFTVAQLYVRVNKFTGEVTSYGTTNIDPGRFKFDDTANIISESEAVAAYAEKIGLSLEYASYFDYETGDVSVFPVYKFNAYNDRFISAVSGDVVEYVYDRATGSDEAESSQKAPSPSMAESSMAADSNSGGSSRASFSAAEIAASEKVSSFISSELALQKLLDAAGLGDLDTKDFDEQYIRLDRDYVNRNRFCYNINLYSYGTQEARESAIYYIYGRVDAETGRVINFDLGFDSGAIGSAQEAEYTEEQVFEAVETFLKREAPGELPKMALENVYAPGADPYAYRGSYYYYQYVRYENEVPFKSNGVNVAFDAGLGRITSYNLNWFDNVSFPDVSGVLPAEDALSAFVEITGCKLLYTTTGKGNAALVYQFSTGDYLDPFTGAAIDYSGAPRIETAAQTDYDDIAGHWCEDVVRRLADNGIVMWSGAFEPDKTMTQFEFLQFLMRIEPYYYYGYSPAMFFADRNIDIKIDDDKIITKQDAAWIITQYLGYAKLAEQPEWFIYPFSDDVSDDFKGCVTICYMLGIISGDGAGSFGAYDNITRAQAAMMLYNLILTK